MCGNRALLFGWRRAGRLGKENVAEERTVIAPVPLEPSLAVYSSLHSAQCLCDGDAGLNTFCLSQGFCHDAGWRPHLRGCACVSHLCWMPMQQVLSLLINVKGERMKGGLEAYREAAVSPWLHRQPRVKEILSSSHWSALQKQSG